MSHHSFESLSPIELEIVAGGANDGAPSPAAERDQFTTGGSIRSRGRDRFTTGGTFGGEGTFTTGGSF